MPNLISVTESECAGLGLLSVAGAGLRKTNVSEVGLSTLKVPLHHLCDASTRPICDYLKEDGTCDRLRKATSEACDKVLFTTGTRDAGRHQCHPQPCRLVRKG